MSTTRRKLSGVATAKRPPTAQPGFLRSGRGRLVVGAAAALLIVAIVVGAGSAAGWFSGLGKPSDPALRALSDVKPPDWSQTDRQVQSYQDTVKASPDNWRALDALGGLYLQKVREVGDPSYYGKAETVFRQALALNPKDFDAMIGLGSLALARHQFEQAYDWGQKARELNSSKSTIYGVIGDALIETGRYDEAVTTFQTMVDLRPDLQSYSRVSYARELHGDLDGAIDAMEKAVEAGVPNTEGTAWTRVQLGNLQLLRGNLDAAERQYDTTLANLPGYVYGIAGQAKVAAARGDNAKAINLYTQAIKIVPAAEFVIALGDLYRVTNRPEQAAQQDKLLRAMTRLFNANGVETDLEMALYELDHGGNAPDVLGRARALYAKRPTIKAADLLGWALYQTGDYQEGLQYAKEALKLGTKDPVYRFHAGMLAAKTGDSLLAQDYLSQALAQNKAFSVLYAAEAQRTLDNLRAGRS